MSSVLLGTLAASLLGNTLAGKGILQASDGVVRTVHEVNQKRQDI